MILQIEKWVEQTHPFDVDSLDLFKEAVCCYKTGAYRAAFIMSYLAFESVVRFKMLSCGKKPENISDEKWNHFKKSVENHDSWEEGVSNILLISPPENNKGNKEMLVDERIIKLKNHQVFVDDFKKWRHTRNNCAHAKGIMTVDASTVECFWNFIRDNIFDVQISGGSSYWSEVIFKSFRDKNEHIEITYQQYIDALCASHLTDEELHKIWESVDRQINRLSFVEVTEKNAFWSYILYNSALQDSFLNYLKKQPFNICEVYKFIPEILKLVFSLEDGASFKNEIFIPWLSKSYSGYGMQDVFWNIVLDVCNNCKTNNDIKRFLQVISFKALQITPTDEQLIQLKELGFFELKKDDIDLRYDYEKAGEQLSNISATLLVLNNIEFDYYTVYNLNEYVKGLAEHSYPWVNQLYNKLKESLSDEAKRQIRDVAKNNEQDNEIELNSFLKQKIDE